MLTEWMSECVSSPLTGRRQCDVNVIQWKLAGDRMVVVLLYGMTDVEETWVLLALAYIPARRVDPTPHRWQYISQQLKRSGFSRVESLVESQWMRIVIIEILIAYCMELLRKWIWSIWRHIIEDVVRVESVFDIVRQRSSWMNDRFVGRHIVWNTSSLMNVWKLSIIDSWWMSNLMIPCRLVVERYLKIHYVNYSNLSSLSTDNNNNNQ